MIILRSIQSEFSHTEDDKSTPEEDLKKVKTAQAAGLLMSGVGSAALAAGPIVKRLRPNAYKRTIKKLGEEQVKNSLKKLRTSGIVLTAAGVPLLAYTTKKLKESKKDNNDSTKK